MLMKGLSWQRIVLKIIDAGMSSRCDNLRPPGFQGTNHNAVIFLTGNADYFFLQMVYVGDKTGDIPIIYIVRTAWEITIYYSYFNMDIIFSKILSIS